MKLLVENGRTGWYMRVLRPGVVHREEPAFLAERDRPEITVRDAHEARLGRGGPELAARVAAVDALNEDLRASLRRSLETPV